MPYYNRIGGVQVLELVRVEGSVLAKYVVLEGGSVWFTHICSGIAHNQMCEAGERPFSAGKISVYQDHWSYFDYGSDSLGLAWQEDADYITTALGIPMKYPYE